MTTIFFPERSAPKRRAESKGNVVVHYQKSPSTSRVADNTLRSGKKKRRAEKNREEQRRGEQNKWIPCLPAGRPSEFMPCLRGYGNDREAIPEIRQNDRRGKRQ